MRKLLLGFAATMLLAGTAMAGEKGFLHCFYFTPVQRATQAEWQAFFKATDELPGKIPGLKHVWYGKLVYPLPNNRQWGVCMEMNNADTLNSYASSPAHANWEKAYFKVRVEGTTTADFSGQ
jgi:hypothetical protein